MTFDVFANPDFMEHDLVTFARDRHSGLRAVIAIHDTHLGPALGGCRIHPYATEAAAVSDVLRLSRGMTFKAAIAGLPLGGGKSVILADPATEKTPAMMRAMGRAVEALGGRYIVAEDVGATVADMDEVATQTRHVSGASGGTGDPSPWTAEGVFLCLETAVRRRFGQGLEGARVCVKGLGAVGWKLAERLHAAGARLTVADVRPENAERARAAFSAAVVAPAEAPQVAAEAFAPCALGAELSSSTIPRLGAPVVCGAANNQLATPADAERLRQRGVTYCPDYLVNAGGLICVSRTAIALDEAAARERLAGLPAILETVLDRAEAEGRSSAEIADAMARERYMPAG
jgi:leucine dehydrogenase